MTPDELRQSFIDHMVAAGSVEIPSDGLVPENDSTTLFTGSGMQPMVPYLLGLKHPSGDDLSNVQRCLRTGDIDEVGDATHLTFFEMIGRWHLNADPATYKRRQIELIFGWQTQVLGLDASRVYISVFAGDNALGIPRDDEAIQIWQDEFAKLGHRRKGRGRARETRPVTRRAHLPLRHVGELVVPRGRPVEHARGRSRRPRQRDVLRFRSRRSRR